MRRAWSIAMMAAMVLASAKASARVTDTWTTPHPGVRHLHRTGGGVDLHVVLVDLTRPEISLVATRPEDGFVTTSEFARRYDAQIAINANFFDRASCGLAVGDGAVMSRSYDDNCRASIGFGRDNQVAVFDSLRIPRGPVPADWMTEVLSGKPFVMRDGRALTNWVRPQHLYRPNPRTAVGVTADRRTLVLLAADGRRRGVAGLTGFQMVAVLREFDVADAVNLDGGGSTALVIDGRLANRPSDGHERGVVSHLGVRVRPEAVWYRAELLDRGAPGTVRQDETAPLWLEARNLGRATWRPSRDGGPSPVLELDDGVVGYVADVAAPTPPGAVGRFELRWLARGAGARRLRGRLRAPDGTDLLGGPLAWTLAVERLPRPRPPRPARALGLARISEVVLPAGLGVVSADLGGCAASPSGPAVRRKAAGGPVLALLLAAARARRRRMR